jgi:5'-nucleotidase (lipoprotein e(P4) family)
MKRNTHLLLILLLSGCSPQLKTGNVNLTSSTSPGVVPGKMFTAVFMQRAAEYKALCFQAFNFAKYRVDQWRPTATKPTAIVTDIDETVLDNSAYAAHQALQGKDYEEKSWAEWTAMAKADTVPGALAFLKYASSKGITIYYVTNRAEGERSGTLKNLQQYNFPNADNEHLILKQSVSSKEARRQQVLQTHNILLLMGDNLADFSALYDRKTTEERSNTTEQLAAEFGNRFIVLPNPNYGDWETALYNYNYRLTPAQKDSTLRTWLKSY